MNLTKVALGIIGGFAAGTLLGILFAPDKGSNTRKRIADKGREYADKLKSKYDQLSHSANEKFENSPKEANDFTSKGKSEYEELKYNA